MFVVLILTTLVVLYLYFLINYSLKNKLYKEISKMPSATDVMEDILFEPSKTGRFFDPIVHSDIFSFREEPETIEGSEMNFKSLKTGTLLTIQDNFN